jgi:hypothetical protein
MSPLGASPHQFICTKWGDKYPASEVNRLYRALTRVQRRPFVLICVTDDPSGIDPAVRTLPLPDLPVIGNQVMTRGWRKLTLFAPELRAQIHGPTVYLDLDVVLVRAMDDFFTHDEAFAVIKDYRTLRYRNRWTGNTSTFFYNASRDYGVYPRLQALGADVLRRYRNEQEFVSDVMRAQGLLRYWPRGWCASYKHDCVPAWPLSLLRPSRPPPEARVIVFHGTPKPEDAVAGVGGKWYRPIKPAPWLRPLLDA